MEPDPDKRSAARETAQSIGALRYRRAVLRARHRARRLVRLPARQVAGYGSLAVSAVLHLRVRRGGTERVSNGEPLHPVAPRGIERLPAAAGGDGDRRLSGHGRSRDGVLVGPARSGLGRARWRTVDWIQLLDDRIGHRRARDGLHRFPDGDRSRRTTTTARGVDDGEGGRSLCFTGSSGVRYDCPFASAPIGATGGCVLGCGGGFCRSFPPPLEEVLTLRRAGPSRRSRIVCRTRLNAGTSAAHR